MSSTIASTQWAIGYIDSGHGHDDGLHEVKLKNKAGQWVDSKQVGAAGVMSAAESAMNTASFPKSSVGDWSKVNLLNQLGSQTWPIVAISYTFVKADLTSMGEKGALLKAYMQYTQSDATGYGAAKGGQLFASEFSFTGLPSKLRALSNSGIAAIKLAPDVTPFEFEWSTDVTSGPKRNTLSCKRADYAEYVLGSTSVKEIATNVASLTARVAKDEQDVSMALEVVMTASGTTNPKKLHWNLMSKMESMAPEPVRMTYRAIGSSSGKVVFWRAEVIGDARRFQ